MKDQDLDTIFKVVSSKNKRALNKALNDEQAFKEIHNYRQNVSHKGQGRAKWRKVAMIEPHVWHALKQMYGEAALKDKKFFKDLMKQPELQPFLTVPITEL